jgi:hypothetical protein
MGTGTLWEMGEQEKFIHGFNYIMQRQISWNNVGKTVSKHNTIFPFYISVLLSVKFWIISTYIYNGKFSEIAWTP